MRSWDASQDASGLRFAVVVSRFNHPVSEKLLDGCVRALEERGASADAVHVAWVPGAFEIPLAARALVRTGRYDALVALGAVIRGATSHFDYVCRGVTDGVRQVAHESGVPVAVGVLTTDDADQALERAGGKKGNKGEEAALVAIEMARLCAGVGDPPGGGA